MRIVVKVGTSTLAYPTGRLNIQRMERLCKTLSDLKNAGHEIILVSSGAIAMGFGKLNLSERPKDMPGKQASAAVGQCELMYVYDKLFTEYNHIVGQLLITAPDIADGGSRKANFHNTMDRLLELGALPVINENDTISTEEIAVGDNDTLSAIVAATVSADLLVLLSDIDGLYDGDPRKNPDAKLIPTVETVDERIIALGGGSGSSLGTGGMATKLLAAQIAVGAGCEMVIANGEKPELLYEYPGKLPDVYFNFSAFFPVGLPFRESVPTESCFRILNSFSPGSSSGSASRTIRFVLCMMQLSMISLRVVTSKSISHTCSAALKKVASVLKRKLRTVSKHVCVPMPVMRWISDFDTCDRAYSVSMNFLNSLSHSSVCCFVGSHEAYNFSKYFISLVSRGLSLPYRAVINTLPIGIFTDERQERKFTCQVLLMTQR